MYMSYNEQIVVISWDVSRWTKTEWNQIPGYSLFTSSKLWELQTAVVEHCRDSLRFNFRTICFFPTWQGVWVYPTTKQSTNFMYLSNLWVMFAEISNNDRLVLADDRALQIALTGLCAFGSEGTHFSAWMLCFAILWPYLVRYAISGGGSCHHYFFVIITLPHASDKLEKECLEVELKKVKISENLSKHFCHCNRNDI